MIRLSIPNFCQDCPEFEADVEKYGYNNSWQTNITCAHLERCRNIKLQLENQMIEEKKKNSKISCSDCAYRDKSKDISESPCYRCINNPKDNRMNYKEPVEVSQK